MKRNGSSPFCSSCIGAGHIGSPAPVPSRLCCPATEVAGSACKVGLCRLSGRFSTPVICGFAVRVLIGIWDIDLSRRRRLCKGSPRFQPPGFRFNHWVLSDACAVHPTLSASGVGHLGSAAVDHRGNPSPPLCIHYPEVPPTSMCAAGHRGHR